MTPPVYGKSFDFDSIDVLMDVQPDGRILVTETWDCVLNGDVNGGYRNMSIKGISDITDITLTEGKELAERYPVHVACAWIGNSARVAAKQVTEDRFAEAVQNPVQHPAVSARIGLRDDLAERAQYAVFGPVRPGAASRKPLSDKKMGPEGFEPPTKRL